ncbi:MAG: hypothetical protein ACYC0V_07965, partial [Armatimonadota bacterium]
MESQDSQAEDQHQDSVSDDQSASTYDVILTWRVHLLRNNPKKLLPVIPVLILSLMICYSMFHSIFYLIVVTMLFIIALADFLFPVRYEITGKSAASLALFSRSRIEWDSVKKYYLDDSGIKLSPFENHTRLEAYRGVYLRFGNNKDEVTAT